MESRTACIVKYITHNFLKDVWAAIKKIAVLVAIGAACIGAVILVYLGMNALKVAYGPVGATQIIAWIIVVIYLAATLYFRVYRVKLDIDLSWMIGGVIGFLMAFMSLAISSGGQVAPPINLTLYPQAAVGVLWGAVLYVMNYFWRSYHSAVEFCDKQEQGERGLGEPMDPLLQKTIGRN